MLNAYIIESVNLHSHRLLVLNAVVTRLQEEMLAQRFRAETATSSPFSIGINQRP